MGEGHWTDRLSEYLDGELSPSERADADRHLEECAECVALLADLGAVAAEARALPPMEPSRDLWPGIQARLTPRVRSSEGGQAADEAARQVGSRESGARVIPLSSRRRVALTIPQLMAASLALAVLSGVAVWAAMAPSSMQAPSLAAEEAYLPPVLAAYEPGMAELEAEYAARREALDPETVHIVERNLAIIDAAIREASEALAADPSSGFLNTHLAESMRRRMTLLREVVSL